MPRFASLKNLALVMLASIMLIGIGYCWPKPPDPRIPVFEAREAAYREQDARHRATIYDLRQSARREGQAVATTIVYLHDTLTSVVEADTTKFVTVERAWLAALADSIAVMAKRTDSMRRDYERAIGVLTVRLSQADSIIALARPIIHDARQRHGWKTDAVLGAGWLVTVLLLAR